jgi:hypothetical protein
MVEVPSIGYQPIEDYSRWREMVNRAELTLKLLLQELPSRQCMNFL